MLTFCKFLSELAKEQILKMWANSQEVEFYFILTFLHFTGTDPQIIPQTTFLVKYWLKLFYFIAFSNLELLY